MKEREKEAGLEPGGYRQETNMAGLLRIMQRNWFPVRGEKEREREMKNDEPSIGEG